MEKIACIAKDYYKNCVKLELYGVKGSALCIIGTIFICISLYLHITFVNISAFLAFPLMIVGVVFWLFANLRYDENLCIKLKAITGKDSDDLNEQKVAYLQQITPEIGESLFHSMKNITDLLAINEKNRSLSSDNIGYYFSKFLFEPESKSRILSLFIYFLSLLVILFVVKADFSIDSYKFFNQASLDTVTSYLSLSLIFIILFYCLLLILIILISSYMIRPIMLLRANQRYLLSYFIGELSKYAFSDDKVLTEP